MPAPTTNEQVTLQASGSKGKALPQNIEAEKTVLSACLLSTGVFEEVSLKLRPEDFYRPAHRIIFETMRDMNARSVPIDVISVADSLKAASQLEAVGGQPYLLAHQLAASCRYRESRRDASSVALGICQHLFACL